MVIVDGTRPAALRSIARLSGSGLGAEAFLRQVNDHLRPAIPFDTGSWLIYDPDALLPVGAVPIDEALSYERMLRYCANENLQDDVNKFRDLARRRVPVGTLEEATGGRPRESRRYRELLQPLGMGHELRLALVSGGACWGGLTLRRAVPAPGFAPDEIAFAARIAAPIAEGLSRAAVAATTGSSLEDAPGVVLLDQTGAIAGATDPARQWLRLLDDCGPAEYPPVAVATAAVQARAREHDGSVDRPAVPSRLRVRASSGQWLVLDGAVCRDSATPPGWVAVIVQPASPGDVLSLVARRYGLSPREQAVVRLVLQGMSTRQIGATMGISPLTVQDHLKAVFAKTDVSSRRELAYRLALSHA